MRILGHIHTFNDVDVIDRSMQALVQQTHPVDEILVVDNASTDATLQRRFPENATVIRHAENRGTSGAVITGFEYALAKNYDWIWILDADSAPRRDALECLVELYRRLSADVQGQVRALACLPVVVATQSPCHGVSFTPTGYKQLNPDPSEDFYECDSVIWSGSLFKVEAVRAVGLPPAEYRLDWGETEYSYRCKVRGFRTFVHQRSIMDHSLGVTGGIERYIHRVGPLALKLPELSAIRLYYMYRNGIYFWLYVYHHGNVFRYIPQSLWMVRHLCKLLLVRSRWVDIPPCLRGIVDGLSKRMDRQYSA